MKTKCFIIHKATFLEGKCVSLREKPERLTELLKAPKALDLKVTTAKDIGIDPILAVHDLGYVDFLKNAY